MLEILIADDDVLLGRAYGRILTRFGHRVSLATSGAEAVQLVRESAAHRIAIDVALVDLMLGDMDGQELAQQIRRHHPAAAIVIVSGHIDAPRAIALWGDCDLAVPKPLSHADLVSLADRFSDRANHLDSRLSIFARSFHLTPREQEVLTTALRGTASEEIARELGCAKSTVDVHWRRILLKTGTRSRSGVLAALAQQRPAPRADAVSTRNGPLSAGDR